MHIAFGIIHVVNLSLQSIFALSRFAYILIISFLKLMHASSTFIGAYTFQIFQLKDWSNSFSIIFLWKY